jgi:hypothetical protein
MAKINLNIPKGPLWTPYLHNENPPKSRVCDEEIPTFVPPLIDKPDHVLSSNHQKKRTNWTLGMDDKSQLVGPDHKQANLPLAPLKQDDWDFQYQPNLPESKINTSEIGNFQELAALLDGANMIYAWNTNQLFGLLRATPAEVTDLNSYTWAPHTDINDSKFQSINPLRPKAKDPYYEIMNPDKPFIVPTIDEVEGITFPTNQLPADPDWITPTPLARQTSNSFANKGAPGTSYYNIDDTKEEIAKYLNSKRWLGGSTVKSPSIYFRDARMMYWMFKSVSICGDLATQDLTLADVRTHNKHTTWWNDPLVYFARSNTSFKKDEKKDKDRMDLIVTQSQYTYMHSQKQWSKLKEALEWEVRTVADLFTILHYHKLPLIAFVKWFSKKDGRNVFDWKLLSVRVSTLSLLENTEGKTKDPSAPKAKKVAKNHRLARLPRPLASIAIPEQKIKTYNVVCSVAISNIKRHWLNGEWCDFMYYQGQHISHVVCLIIDQDHPQGYVKYFTPTTL